VLTGLTHKREKQLENCASNLFERKITLDIFPRTKISEQILDI
jgi:hypothetical protein